MCPQVATEKQAQRTFARLHGVEVLDRAHRLACQLTRPSDWPPGVAPEGERQVWATRGTVEGPAMRRRARRRARRGGAVSPRGWLGGSSW